MDNFSRLRERSQPANHNQDQAGSPDEESGQRRLDDFGFKRLRVQFVVDVHEHDDGFVMPREDRAVWVFVFIVAKKTQSANVWMCQVRRGFQACRRVRGPAGIHVLKLDRTTGEMLFAVGCRDVRPIVDSRNVVSTCPVDYATSVPTEKVNYSVIPESVLPWTSILMSLTQKWAILSAHTGCGNGDDRVPSRWKGWNRQWQEEMYLTRATDHGDNTRIRCCVWQRSRRVGRRRQWWSLCQWRKAKVRKRLWHQFSRHTERILGERFEPSTARSWEKAYNSSGRPRWESKNTSEQVKVKVPPKH